jgi:hypothetical protein
LANSKDHLCVGRHTNPRRRDNEARRVEIETQILQDRRRNLIISHFHTCGPHVRASKPSKAVPLGMDTTARIREKASATIEQVAGGHRALGDKHGHSRLEDCLDISAAPEELSRFWIGGYDNRTTAPTKLGALSSTGTIGEMGCPF